MEPKEDGAKECSVAEMYMLSEGHMLGLKLKSQKCLNSAQKIPSVAQIPC